MKKIVFIIIISALTINVLSQEKEALRTIYINKNVSTHFVSNEEIKYVDVSIKKIIGDFVNKNTIKVKPLTDSIGLSVITIITERHLVQYNLVYTNDITKAYTRYNVPFSEMRSYINPATKMTKAEMYNYAYRMFISPNKYYDVSSKKHKITLTLNNIYTVNEYFFVDISLENKTNIIYDIEQIRFKISDKKIVKATNNQDVEIYPLLELNKRRKFKKRYKNIFVFEKFTFPDEKIFTVEISEKQISGRNIKLRINYEDLLNADVF